MPEITFSGKSSAKGRNGYFTLRSAELTLTRRARRPVHLEFFSQRHNGAPVYLQLTQEDAVALRDLLVIGLV